VRGVALSIVLVIASCAPDYGHSAFLCDDAGHGCPDGQDCVAGRCRRGEPTGDGVVCGAGSGAARCAPAEQCCVEGPAQLRCRPAGELCPGITMLCDGAEDCRAGDRCCADGGAVFCDAACEHTACLDADDCPRSTAPNCCFDLGTPWGACSPRPC
jgi:hypothetical protein